MYPGMGTGLITLTEKPFCTGDTCKDLKVCWFADQDGKEVFYLPVNGETNISKLKVQKLNTTYNTFIPTGKNVRFSCQWTQFIVFRRPPYSKKNLNLSKGSWIWLILCCHNILRCNTYNPRLRQNESTI